MKTETVGCRLAAIVIVMMPSQEKEARGTKLAFHRIHTPPAGKGKAQWQQQLRGEGPRSHARKLIISHRHPIGNRRCDNRLIINYILFLFDANDNNLHPGSSSIFMVNVQVFPVSHFGSNNSKIFGTESDLFFLIKITQMLWGLEGTLNLLK